MPLKSFTHGQIQTSLTPKQRLDLFDTMLPTAVQIRSGSKLCSGVVVSKFGHVLTVYDVLRDSESQSIEVSFHDSEVKYEAKIVKYLENMNLAILHLTNNVENVFDLASLILTPKVEEAAAGGYDYSVLSNTPVFLGQHLYSIGNPYREPFSCTSGYVCLTEKTVRDLLEKKPVVGDRDLSSWSKNTIFFQAADLGGDQADKEKVLLLGASGSPIFDAKGQLVGILAFEDRSIQFVLSYRTIEQFILSE